MKAVTLLLPAIAVAGAIHGAAAACPLDGVARLGQPARALSAVAAKAAVDESDPRCASLGLGVLDFLDRRGATACDAAARLAGEPGSDEPDALAIRAALEWRCGHPRDALRLSRAALVRAPESALAWRVAGQVLEARFRNGAARAAYERALAIDAAESGSLSGLSRIAGDRALRRALLERFARAGPPRGEPDENVRAARQSIQFLDALGDRATWTLEKAELPGSLSLEPYVSQPGTIAGWIAKLGIGAARDVPVLIDSGASGLHLDPRLARRAKLLGLAGGTLVGGGGSGEHDVDRGMVDRLELGPVAFGSALGVVAGESLHSTGVYRAIVGLDVFGGMVVRFRPRDRSLEIDAAIAPDADDDPLAVDPWPADPAVLPILLVEGQLLVPARFTGSESAADVLALVDTGAVGTVLDVAVADRLGDYRRGRLGSARLYGGAASIAGVVASVTVTIGGLVERLRNLAVLDLAVRARIAGVYVGGFVGEDVWSRNGFELDLASGTLQPVPR